MTPATRILVAFAFLGVAFLAGLITRSEEVFISVFGAGVVASFILRRFVKAS